MSSTTSGPPSEPRLKKSAAQSDPSEAYGSIVAEAIAAEPRDSTYRPAAPTALTITGVHQPKKLDELAPEELTQLRHVLGAYLEEGLAGDEMMLEAAEVVDAEGELRYRLYGWNYGVGYVMPAEGLNVLAYASQHDIEHWRLEQRDLFYAMDAALRKPGHGFRQPLTFCWWREECWEELEGTVPGTVASEPYVNKASAK